MEKIDQIRSLASALGWIEIRPQNNPYMISFRSEENKDIRVNVYFTKMTVTVQSAELQNCIVYKSVNMQKFEDILTEQTI